MVLNTLTVCSIIAFLRSSLRQENRHANRIFFCGVLYCYLWPVSLYHIFPRYLTNDTIFRERLLRENVF
jgi:hypothetical protein